MATLPAMASEAASSPTRTSRDSMRAITTDMATEITTNTTPPRLPRRPTSLTPPHPSLTVPLSPPVAILVDSMHEAEGAAME